MRMARLCTGSRSPRLCEVGGGDVLVNRAFSRKGRRYMKLARLWLISSCLVVLGMALGPETPCYGQHVSATVADPNAIVPFAAAVNEATNTIYVVNDVSNNITVINGFTNAT